MKAIVASHPSSRQHDTGPWHPERAGRIDAVLRGLADSGVELEALSAPPIERAELALVHEPSYIELIERFCSSGGGALDVDTYVTPHSWQAALTSAGAVRALAEELEVRSDATGFAATRPPGHHALPGRAMGFCLFNNVAVTAALIRSRGERVAVLDWDVHHGNGTQAMLSDDPGALYVSIHQAGFYPFEGDVDDIDRGEGKGTVVNVPLPAGTGGDVYRRAWEEIALPVLTQFEADWVLVSAGFDGHVDDPLAEMRLRPADYGWMAGRLAETHPISRTVLSLEGGYDLDGLRRSAAATLAGLAGRRHDDEPPLVSPPGSTVALGAAAEAVSRHWSL